MSEPKSRTIGSHHSLNAHCKVCGDRASGKHYGVPSCDGCRGFFKRSIRRNLEYACKEGGKCIVDVSRRNQCQACRFAKCLAANMRPEAVQHERAPRSCVPNPHLTNGLAAHLERGVFTSSPHIPLHHHHHHPHNGLLLPMPIHLPTAFSSQLEPQLQRHYAHFGAIHSNMFDSFSHFAAAANSNLFPAPPPLISANSSNLLPKSTSDPKNSPIFPPSIHAADVFKSFSDRNRSDSDPITIPSGTAFSFLPKSKSSIDGKEDEVSSSEEISTLHSNLLIGVSGSSSPNNQEIVFETAAKLLFLAVKWTKSIQSFTQLNANDQNILLEECWAELFVIMSAQYGLPIGNLMISSNDISIHKLYKAIHQILLLRLNHTEIACLKTLTLFRPDCVGLTSPYEIAMLQDESLNLLLESCGGATRMGHILLTLPYIRAAADRKVIQEVLFKKTVGEVAIEKLLGDLIRN